MPKVSYEFNIEYGHDDVERLKTFQNAERYRSALSDVGEYLRKRCKYEEDKAMPSWDTLRRIFFRTLDDNDLSGSDL